MNAWAKKSVIGALLLAGGAGAGWGLAQWSAAAVAPASAAAASPGAAATDGRQVLYWYDPMVPTQRFDKPGKSPYMDMPLVPKYADEQTGPATHVSVAPGTVQELGMRTAEVEQRTVGADIHVVGTVLLNDRDVSIVQARAAGFVERVYARAPGDVVAAGAPLADLLLPEWVAAQREFLAVRALGDASLTRAARQRLTLLGMPGGVIARVERSGKPLGNYTVRVPRGGLVAELMVRQGMNVAAGETLARINGLSSMWVEAAVPEAQSGPLQWGQTARVRLAAFPGDVLQARIVAILPQTNRDTRTVRVRLELPNPGERLKAGMSGQVTLEGHPQSVLLVPSEAVIRTGRRALAYVVDGSGKFHPVEVELGAEIGDQLVIKSGLSAGQKVVASAQFLIDSEASLRGVMPAQSPAPTPSPASAPAPATGTPAATEGAATSQGVIQAISPAQVTIAHQAIPALQWPAMTMEFKLAHPQLASGLAPQQHVRFTLAQQGDDYVVTAIEKLP